MTLLSSDLQVFLSATVSADPATNGGRLGGSPIALSAKNNAFPDVNSALLASGGTRWRKFFLANLNAQNLAGQAVMVVMDRPTAYGDYALFRPGTQDDVESQIAGDIHCCAVLAANAGAGAGTIAVLLEDAAQAAAFVAGREILISSRAAFENTASTTGAEELRKISGSPTVAGLNLTITLDQPLAGSYTVAAGTRVSTVYRAADLSPALSDWAESGTGDYDEGNYPVRLTNLGTIRQRWTIQYTSAQVFTLSGDTLGLVGTFQTDQDAAPVNPAGHASGQPYLRIPAGGHGSGHVSGDKITFATSPAACPLWVKSVIPPGTTDFGPSEIPICWQVEGEV